MTAAKRGRIVAGCLFACLIAALWLSGPAHAGCLSQTVGNTTIHNCDGKISTSHTVGGTTVHNFGGKTGTSHRVGTTTFHNFDGKAGWSHEVGGVTIHTGPLFDNR